MKTYQGWLESPKMSITSYLEPGDEVDKEMYDKFANAAPPRFCDEFFIQCGEESFSQDGIMRYMTFSLVKGDKHLYLGCLPAFKQPKLGAYIAVIGSRTFDNATLLADTLRKVKTPILGIVSGGAGGADALAKEYAKSNGINYLEYLPAWKMPWWSDSYCKRTAAAIRNAQIMNASEGVVAFWNGDEKSGTAQAIRIAKSLGKPVHVVKF